MVSCGDGGQAAPTVDTVTPTTAQSDTVVPAISGCARQQTVQMQGGAVADVATLADIGRLGGSVLVVEVAPEPSRTIVDEDPAPVIAGQPLGLPANSPYVLTRYDVTAMQVVVWPDSAPTPTADDDELILDIDGGTYNCFTLDVSNAVTLEPGATYLIAAGVRNAHELRLWDANNALKIDGTVIGHAADGVALPEALAAPVGQPITSLPPLSVVHSILLP